MKEIHKKTDAVDEIIALRRILERSNERLNSIDLKEDGKFKKAFDKIRPKIINLQIDLSFIYATLYSIYKQDIAIEYDKKRRIKNVKQKPKQGLRKA